MSDPHAIRLLIADDHGVVREGLRTLLTAAGFQVVAMARTGREALQQALRHRPEVVLLDIRMPDMDGLHALEQIKARLPTTAVIILTTYANPSYLTRAIASGAAGYLTKDTDPQAIVTAVQAVATGESLVDQQMLRRALRSLHPESRVPTDMLTEQELTVLRLIAQGMSNRDIAAHLHISLNTVKTHVKHIFAKLGVSDRTQAAVWAWRHGLGE